MHDAELRRLHLAARDHRTRAALAREEAAVRGFGWWGHALLQQSADYYERRACEVDLELRRLTAEAEGAMNPPSPRRRRRRLAISPAKAGAQLQGLSTELTSSAPEL